MNKQVIVTGGGGFLGSNLVEHLLDSGLDVITTTHSNQKNLESLKERPNLRIVKVDLSDYGRVLDLLAKTKPEVIFHTAALHSPTLIDCPIPYYKANVEATLNLLEASRVMNIKKFIHSSSMSVYGLNRQYLPVDEVHPTAPYDFYSQTKLQSENLVKYYANNYGLNSIILRYVGIFGPRRKWGAVTNFTKNALANKPLQLNNNICWDIISAKDVAQANLKSFQNIERYNFEIINIGSGQEVGIVELAENLISLCNSGSQIEKANDFPTEPGSHFYFNINKAKQFIDFSPSDLNVGLNDLVNYQKKYESSNSSA